MDLPPQVLKKQVRDLAASQDLQSLRDGAALETFGPRMPVLQAFQEFLELERRRARQRLVVVASGFLAILLLVIAGGSLLAWRFAGQVRNDVKTLEKALAAAREENSSMRGQTAAMQLAIEDAQKALGAMRSRLDEAGKPAPAPDLSRLATALGLLQEVHRLRSEQLDLSVRQVALQEGLKEWERDQAEEAARREELASQQADLARAVKDFAARQQDLSARLKTRQEARMASVGATAVDPAALALLQELHRLHAEQPALAQRQASLQAELDRLDASRAANASRREAWTASRAELAQAVDGLLARQQDLQVRITALR